MFPQPHQSLSLSLMSDVFQDHSDSQLHKYANLWLEDPDSSDGMIDTAAGLCYSRLLVEITSS